MDRPGLHRLEQYGRKEQSGRSDILLGLLDSIIGTQVNSDAQQLG